MKGSPWKDTATVITRLLMVAEHIIHILAALLLIIAAVGISFQSLIEIKKFSMVTVLTLISNSLLILIIREVLWTIIRFLKTQDVSIIPFVHLGVVSSIRQMLYVEAQKSTEKVDPFIYFGELGVNAIVILILMASFYLWQKGYSLNVLKKSGGNIEESNTGSPNSSGQPKR